MDMDFKRTRLQVGSEAHTQDLQNSLSRNYCGSKCQADKKDSKSLWEGESTIG